MTMLKLNITEIRKFCLAVNFSIAVLLLIGFNCFTVQAVPQAFTIAFNVAKTHSVGAVAPTNRETIQQKCRLLTAINPRSVIISSTMLNSQAVNLKFTEFSQSSSADTSEAIGQSLQPPVIILHGLLGNKRNFSSIASSLSKQLRSKRKIYVVDVRNHGDNTHDWRWDMSYSSMAADVAYFCDQHNIKSPVIVGHSMGGKVAQAVALLYPKLVSGLCIIDIAPVEYTPENDGSWRAVKLIIDALVSLDLDGRPGVTKKDIDLDLRKTVEDPALRSFVLTNIDMDRSTGVLRWKINLDAITNQLDIIAGFDLGENSNFEHPLQYEGDTFFINGGASRFVRSVHMKTIADYFPNHMLTTIRGAGHWVHAEAPDATLALLKKYLDR